MTSGESHGPALAGIISGLPSGLSVSVERINSDLARRQQGVGRSSRQEIETDTVKILSGLRHGLTIGSPIALVIENRDHENWRDVMSVEQSESNEGRAYPRPGHAGLAGMLKWDLDDARNVLERASGRSTAMTVAIGSICRQYLEEFGTYIGSRVLEFGEVVVTRELGFPPNRIDIGDDPSILLKWHELTDSQVQEMRELVDEARESGRTIGGIVQAVSAHVPPGLGTSVLTDERLDSRIAGAVMGIPGIKAVEIGAGTDLPYVESRNAHDRYAREENPDHEPWSGRLSNMAGGIEGGITNGEPVSVTAWMKPLSTIQPPHRSIERTSGKVVDVEKSERSDVSAVESVACVVEAVLAMELASAHIEEFGGSTISRVHESYKIFMDSINSG